LQRKKNESSNKERNGITFCEYSKRNDDEADIPIPQFSVCPKALQESKGKEEYDEHRRIVRDTRRRENHGRKNSEEEGKEKERLPLFLVGEEERSHPDAGNERGDREQERFDLYKVDDEFPINSERVKWNTDDRGEKVIERRLKELPCRLRFRNRPVRENMENIGDVAVCIVRTDGKGSLEDVEKSEENTEDNDCQKSGISPKSWTDLFHASHCLRTSGFGFSHPTHRRFHSLNIARRPTASFVIGS